MTHRRLSFPVDLTESFAERWIKKERVITETVFALELKGDSSFTGIPNDQFYHTVRFWRAQRQGANKPPGSFLLRNMPQFVKQLRIIFFVVAFLAGVARRVDAGRSAESVNLQTRIIGQGQITRIFGQGPGFLKR